jgi:hypothetical protein
VISLKRYEKMLVAFHDKELRCHAKKGSWLYIAHKKDTKKSLFRLPHYLHYFVSLDDERLPSEFGVVKILDQPITALDLAIRDYTSRKIDTSNITDEIVKEYEWFLEKVNRQPEHLPMGLSWLDRPISQTKELRFHKKFFTDLTTEEKKELFET